MIPIMMQVPHKPGDGLYGDCMRACIASLLMRSPYEIPHFADGGVRGNEMRRRIDAYLATLNMYLHVSIFDADNIQSLLDDLRHTQKGYYILGAGTPSGGGHAVVCYENKIAHDPSPTVIPLQPFPDGTLFVFTIAVLFSDPAPVNLLPFKPPRKRLTRSL